MNLFKTSLALLFLFSSLMGMAASSPRTNKVAIFIPDSQGNYRSIFQEIKSGVEQLISVSNNVELVEFKLSDKFDAKAIIGILTKKQINQVIVLGKQGYRLAKALPAEKFDVVSGGLPISPGKISGVSYIADPIALFNYLNAVAPSVKRIHVAYSVRSKWVIDIAKQAAKGLGLSIEATKVAHIKEASEYYKKLLKSNLSKQDAIWLPYDKVSSHDKYILPKLLEAAWKKEVIVFSSKPHHAKRGALFSAFPDNKGVGSLLYKLVVEIAAKSGNKVVALNSLQLAVNIRTAAHLGFKYSTEEKKQFKLTFPE